jgi:EpsI family protein
MNTREMPGEQLLTGVILFSCLTVLALIYHSTSVSLYQVWTAENSLQSHGLLLLPLSSYLLAREWYSKRQGLRIGFRPVFLIGLVFCSVAWLLSDIAQIQVVSQILLILILCLSVFALFGTAQSISLGFPVLILLSATSVWSVLSQPLQEPTAYFVNQMLHLTGYTSFQEGFFITIPEGVFEVGDTCSGLRYQIAAVTLSILYVFFARFPLYLSLIYIFLASAVAFLSNSIRIYIVVLSGHYTNMTHSLLDDHIWLGWLVFVICYAGFMVATLQLEKKTGLGSAEEEKDKAEVKQAHNPYSKSLVISSVLLLCASIGPIYSALMIGGAQHQQQRQASLDLEGLELRRINEANSWNPMWIGADFEIRTTYRYQDQNIDFYSAYYGHQEQGKEAVSDLNQAYNRDLWKADYRHDREISLTDGSKITIQEEVITDSRGDGRLIWSWYYIGGYQSSGKLNSKFYGMLAGLRGRNDAAVVVLCTDIAGKGTMQRSAMQGFINQTAKEIEQYYDMN